MRNMTAVILRASGSDNSPAWRLKKAATLFNQGHALRKSNPDLSEKLCRESLVLLREAYLLTKKSKFVKQLHRYGKALHAVVRCTIPFKDGFYEQSCPVLLSHLRHGVSPGLSGKEICSLCGANMLDCDHVKGWYYDNVPARRIKGVCNICQLESCTHELSRTYGPVMAIAFMEDVRLDHCAIVENPKDPLAAFVSESLEEDEVLELLPEREKATFKYGESILYCNHCVGCKG